MSFGGPETVTQTTNPPDYIAGYLENLASSAQGAYDTGQLGQVAGFTPEQREARQRMLDYIYGSQAQTGIDTAQASLGRLLNADDIANNPAVQGLLESQSNLLTTAFREQILPGISGEAVMTGGIGGSRQGIAEGLAAGRTSQAIGDSSTQILSNAYSRGLTAQAQGLALAPSVNRMPLSLFGTAEAIGESERQLNQAQMDQMGNALRQLGELLGLATFGGTVTETSTGGGSNDIMQGLGLLLTFFGFPGAGAGAAAGASTGAGIFDLVV